MLAHATLAAVLALMATLPLAWKWGLGAARVGAVVLLLSAAAGAVVPVTGVAAVLGPVATVALIWGLTMAGSTALLAYRFYRDPERRPPGDEGAIVSPAEGTVIYVHECRAGQLPVSTKHGKPYGLHELTKTPLQVADATVIGISMSFLDVHVNRAPVPGTVTLRQHFAGTFGSLRKAEMIFANERATTVIDRGDMEVAVVQIASRLVRQIVSFVQPGDTVVLGQRTGVIRFGSQVDVVVPAHDGLRVLVATGDHVKAAESVLATCPKSGPSPVHTPAQRRRGANP